ncbi:DedA family protein [Modestobacter muralis]|uniref:DedA family protein n=1 Tax=Modestobacter muralis TaxID=1608614 RepID=A0A6P0ERE8_9ACTN|nr:VTT domain-containing protein [Modestobacter muralis]NEK93445.1 DedA family protein [Modestobacter muralis]NEN50212.1 DedA family protein [Modestobacter muralis]
MTIEAAPAFLDSTQLLNTFGLVGLLAVVFAETGLLVGFFLPGDSLLFTAGMAAAGGFAGVTLAPLWVLLLLLPLAAIAGNLVGYWIGHRAGPAVFKRPESRFFKAEHVERANAFFTRHGARTIVLARFVPILRTFATVMAGASRMDLRVYVLYSVVGGVLWAAGVTALGYWLGQVSVIHDHIELFAIGVVVLSLVPVAFELLRARRRAA